MPAMSSMLTEEWSKVAEAAVPPFLLPQDR
jgi:hypothetical protein